MVNEFLIQKWLALAPQEQIADMQSWLEVAMATIAIAFTLAHLSFRFVENPVIKWARGLEKGRQTAPALERLASF